MDDPHHGIVENITRSEEGQIFTKLQGCSYIYKGYPDHKIMDALDTSMDISWIVANILRKKIVLLGVIMGFVFFRPIMRKIFLNVCNEYFKVAYSPLERKKFFPNEGREYCKPIKEIYRVTQEVIKDIKNERMQETISKFRDLILLKIEMDTAYRFKVQDVLPMIDLVLLKRDPVRAIRQLIDLVQGREFCGDQKIKWGKIKRPITLFLKISKKRKKGLIKFFSWLDLNKIRIDEDDWYFCLQRQDYSYRGWSFENRVKERARLDEEKGHNIPRVEVQKYKPDT